MKATMTIQPNTILQIRGLSKTYREAGRSRKVLDDVNLDIQAGEFFVLLGKSGSGKSTLLNLISGIDKPDSGHILIGDTEITTLDERRQTLFRRDHIGIVFQFFNLIPTLTVLENITLPGELRGEPRREIQKRGMALLERVGLADRAGDFPDQLSGGEQQRVAIARALVARPKIVLADEPTGNLDSQSGQAVLDLLRRASREQGQTMVMVTHDHRAAASADRVVFLKDGQTVNMVSLDDTGGKTRTQTVAAVMTEVGL